MHVCVDIKVYIEQSCTKEKNSDILPLPVVPPALPLQLPSEFVLVNLVGLRSKHHLYVISQDHIQTISTGKTSFT